MKIISFIALVALILTAVILNATNPSSAGPFGILAFFVCLYVLFICLTYVVFLTSERIAAKFFNFKNSRNESKYKTYYYLVCLSCWRVFLYIKDTNPVLNVVVYFK